MMAGAGGWCGWREDHEPHMEGGGPCAGVEPPDAGPVVMAAAEALMARWEDRGDLTRNSLTIIGEDPRTVASVAVAAAVAAVRADLADQIEREDQVASEGGKAASLNYALGWNARGAHDAALVRGQG